MKNEIGGFLTWSILTFSRWMFISAWIVWSFETMLIRDIYFHNPAIINSIYLACLACLGWICVTCSPRYSLLFSLYIRSRISFWEPSSLAIVFSSPISNCCMLAPTTLKNIHILSVCFLSKWKSHLSSSSMSVIFFSAPSARSLPRCASASNVAWKLILCAMFWSNWAIVSLPGYQFPADVIKLVLWVTQGDLGVSQLLVKVVDGLLIGWHLQHDDHRWQSL